MNLPMPGDGFGEEWQFREILKIIDDPERRPVLVHCARGTCRTGAAVAMYRFERDGWTIDDVAVEMRRQTYRYGWLPGYIYAMAKNKPASALPQPEMLYEHNRPADQTHGLRRRPRSRRPSRQPAPPRSAMTEHDPGGGA